MKTLYLLRHAKSDWSREGLDDHERALAPRGERACLRIGDWLAREVAPPDLVLCSSARRAVDTLERLLPRLGTRPAVRVDRSLYLATPSDLLAVVAGVEDEVAGLMLVGHNPGMHAFAVELAGGGDREVTRRLSRKFPTAALAVLRFSVGSWREIRPGEGTLDHFVTPRSLGD